LIVFDKVHTCIIVDKDVQVVIVSINEIELYIKFPDFELEKDFVELSTPG